MSKTCPVSLEDFRSGWLRLPDLDDDAFDARLFSFLISACEYIEPKTGLTLIGDDEGSPPVTFDDVPESVKNAIQVYAANLFTHPIPDEQVLKAVKLAVERLISPYRSYQYPSSSDDTTSECD